MINVYDFVRADGSFDARGFQHQQVIEELRLSRWCTVHKDTLFFCEHRHQEQRYG